MTLRVRLASRTKLASPAARRAEGGVVSLAQAQLPDGAVVE